MIILFDGICNFCNSSVNTIIKFDTKIVFKFAALQSNFGQQFLKDNSLNSTNFDTIIYIENDKFYIKSDAFFKIISKLGFPLNLILVFKILPHYLLTQLYDLIAKNRYKIFGQKESCMIPSESIKNRFLN